PVATPAQPGAITGSTVVCQNSTGNGYSITAVPGATSYTWTTTGVGTIVGASTGTSITVTASAGAGTGSVTVATNNGSCTSTAATLPVTRLIAPAQPSTITGSTSIAGSSPGNGYSVTSVAGVTYTWSVPASVGTVTAGAGTNSITVTAAGSAGSGAISVTATNTCGTSTARTLTVTVTANQPPVANDDQNDVPRNTPTTGNVILNDNDPDLGALTVQTTPTVAPLHGTLVLAANGSYTYTPATGYLGLDQFSYRVCDVASTCANATVFLRVYNPATACVSGTGTNLLANPSFTSGNTGFNTTLVYVAPPATQATGSPNGLYPEDTYAVTANVSIYHQAFTGTGRTGAGDRFMAVNASPVIKTMYAQTVTVQPNRYYTFSAYFKNLITNRNIAVPQVGFVINGQSTSGIVTIPEEAAAGPANVWTQFSDVWYSGSNTTATFEIRNLTIQRNGNDLGVDDVYFGTCNLPPVAAADIYNTPAGTPITFSLTNNDSDGDGTIVPSTVVLTGSAPGTPRSYTDASGNTFVVDAAGNLTFTPAAGFLGMASITYTVQDDGAGTSNPGVIAVTVQAPTTDIAVAITAPSTTAIAGQPTTVTVVSTNNGPSTGYNLVQSLELRPGQPATTLRFNGQAGLLSGSTITFSSGATYNVTSGVLTFPTLASQVVGATATNTVTFAAPGSGPVALTASVRHSALDPVPANNTAALTLSVTSRFDLLTTISGPTNAVAGNQATFSVITANSSTSMSAANNVVQTVQLPVDLEQVFVTNNGTYDKTTGVVTFPAVSNFSPGQQIVNTISFDAPVGNFTASATVRPNTAATGDVNLANNTASAAATTSVAPSGTDSANPFVTISASASYVAPGTPVNLTIVGGNVGPDPADGVSVSVQLTTGLTFTSLDGGTYDPASGMLTFVALSRPAGPLVAGAGRTYVVTLLAPAVGPVLAAAVVTSTTRDVVASNNYMSTRIDVYPQSDLAITLSAPATANAGDPIVYTVTTTNLSGVSVRNLDQTLQLAPNLTGVTVSGGTYNSTTGLVTLPLLTSLPAGASLSYAISLFAPSDITLLRAVAAVASLTPETSFANNTATATTTLSSAADVTIAITGPSEGIVNSPVSYVVTTTNNGPSIALSTTPVVQLPRNLILINLPAGATYVPGTGLLTLATLTNLPAGGSNATAFTVVMPEVSRLVPTATAQVTAATNDRNLANNFASMITTPNAQTEVAADLVAAVSVKSGGVAVTSAIPAQSLTFTATFTNNSAASGTTSATSVLPRLALPTGLNVDSVIVSNGGTYNVTTGLVTWPVSATPLALGQAYAYTVRLPAPASGPLTATAVVSSATSDNVPANNSASTSVTIAPRANVTSRVAAQPNAQPGESVTYSITTINDGPSGASDVQTTVTLPAGTTNVILPAGATRVVDVVTLPLDAFQTPGVNGQQTYLITFTPNPASNSSRVTSTVTTTTVETNLTDNGGSATTIRANVLPVPTNIVNALAEPVGSTAGIWPISPLAGSDADGSVVRYTVTALPPASQGVLYVNGVEFNTTNFPSLRLDVTQATQLEFDPDSSFAGNVFFQYTVTDNRSGTSLTALYTLPIGRDTDSYYTVISVPAGTIYTNGQIIANLFDANGGEYAAAGSVNDTGTRSVVITAASAPLPDGVAINATTGQLTVSDPTLLVPGSYTIEVQTVDEFGGTNLVIVTFTISNPLPVELTTFEAKGRGVDAALTWATASEDNNDHFSIERSTDGGRTFVEIGQRGGAGTTQVPQDYAWSDLGVGRTARTVYYRLRQVDTDGTSSLSDVRPVTFSGKLATNMLRVYPNPTVGATTVDLTDVAMGTYAVSLYDVTGRLVRATTQAGGTQQELDVHDLPMGTYLLHVTGVNGFSTATRMVKQ
ncbi:MAG: cadherin-like domain-containing protein, partial [Hymenobacteraceae bacterium]|nr:cadherin-like domain-containing protein [Hymenobacteraceae bacterium]